MVVARPPRMILQQCQHAHGVRLRGAIGKRHDGGVDGINSRLDARVVGRAAEAGGLVRVEDHRDLHPRLQARDDLVRDVRRNQTGHVLYADRIAAHRLDRHAVGDEFLDRVHRTGRVANHALRVLARPLRRAHRGLDVAQIVQRIEDAEDVHAVLRRRRDKRLDDIVGKVRVLDDVLPAQQHHVRRAGRAPAQGIKPVEGKLAEKTQPRVDGRPTPGLEAAEAEFVKQRQRRQHLGRRHARGGKRLVTVPQDGVVEDDRTGGHKRTKFLRKFCPRYRMRSTHLRTKAPRLLPPDR